MSHMFKSNRFTSSSSFYLDDDGVVFDNPVGVGYLNFSVTEQAGYKPAKLQVLDFMLAGERLVASQKALYYQTSIEPLFDEEGNAILPRLLKTRDPYTAKKDMDFFNSKLNEYKQLFNNRKQEEFSRRVAEHDKYKKFYDENYKKNTSESS